MQRNTVQRTTILNNMKQRCDHPTAEMVYTSVRNELPKISLATVYRNLKGLAEDREIISFTQNGKEHFDGTTRPHMHFCCTNCGKIEDVMFPGDSDDGGMEFSDGFLARNIIVEGLCSDCRKKLSKIH